MTIDTKIPTPPQPIFVGVDMAKAPTVEAPRISVNRDALAALIEEGDLMAENHRVTMSIAQQRWEDAKESVGWVGYCENENCSKPIFKGHYETGQNGEYCSDECLGLAEPEGEPDDPDFDDSDHEPEGCGPDPDIPEFPQTNIDH